MTAKEHEDMKEILATTVAILTKLKGNNAIIRALKKTHDMA